MNKSLVIITTLAAAISLASCKNESKAPAPAPSPQASVAAVEAPAVTPGPAQAASESPAAASTPSAQSNPEEKFDFRRARWGMTKEEVKKTERKKPEHETEDSITYSGKYGKLLTAYSYKFIDGKLQRAGVLHTEKLANDSMYLENYENLKKDITEEYGPPALDEEKPLKPGLVIDPDKKAEAVCGGDLMLSSAWDIPGSLVVLMIRAEDKKCLVSLVYMSEGYLRSYPAFNTTGQNGTDN